MTWTPQRHQAAKDRCEKATPGSWQVGGPFPTVSVIRCIMPGEFEPLAICFELSEANGLHIGREAAEEDAGFIAHARQDLPDALAEIDRLQGVIEELNGTAALRRQKEVAG